MNKKFKNLIKLSSQIRIYVPSTTDADQEFDNSKEVDKALSFLSGSFGGATSYAALGCWQSQEKGLIKEHVTICEAFTNSETLERKIDEVVEYCEALKGRLTQEAIALEINKELYFV